MTKIASPKSASWALSILSERDVDLDALDKCRLMEALRAGECEQRTASWIIDTFRDAPRLVPAAPAPSNLPEVPEGRYALPHADGTKFYKIDCPTEGKWAGYVFVKALASDTEYPIRNRDEKARILREVAADPTAALVRYGHEVGACGVCGRTLTDEASRAAGIGPVCAGRL